MKTVLRTMFVIAAFLALQAAGSEHWGPLFGSGLSPLLYAAESSGESGGTPLHDAAANGHGARVRSLIADGAEANAKDSLGRTPLHHAAAGGHKLAAEALLTGGADINAADSNGRTPLDLARRGGHGRTAAFLVEKGALVGSGEVEAAPEEPTSADELPTGKDIRPDAPFQTKEAYSKAIGEEGVLIDGEHIMLFAPKRRNREAAIIAGYLERAYTELFALVGVHTRYKIIVYHFPKGSKYGWGGTSICVIWYNYDSLALEKQKEWTQHKVPRVSGYIEEMAHNFRDSTKAEFGWEAMGWTLGAKATDAVAGNPVHTREVRNAMGQQSDTYKRYRRLGNRLPTSVPANKADRIHILLLIQAEKKYGPTFWPDFFAQVRKERARLWGAIRLRDGDAVRNERYRLSVECFDRLPGLEFKKMLEENGISTTVEIKSLAKKADWNRKYR